MRTQGVEDVYTFFWNEAIWCRGVLQSGLGVTL